MLMVTEIWDIREGVFNLRMLLDEYRVCPKSTKGSRDSEEEEGEGIDGNFNSDIVC